MGKTCMATAVREENGEIQVEAKRIKTSNGVKACSKIPILRGCVNMVLSMVRGTGALMRSASVIGDDEEPSRFEKWLAEKFKLNIMDLVSVISTFLGVVLALGLFMFLPTFLVSLICKPFPQISGTAWEYVLLGVFKFAIFIAYLGLILLMRDMRRMYQYHGAEHKTITCYELGLGLTPENAKTCTRIHDRCGTSFLFIVLLINVLILSLVNWYLGIQNIENGVLKLLARLGVEAVLLPILTGLSYEVLKFLAKHDNFITKFLKLPGMLLQKVFTTREPDEDMLEVAIVAFQKVLEMDADESVPETFFVTSGILSEKLESSKKLFRQHDIDESDAEWIYSLVLDIKRSELTQERVITMDEAKVIEDIIEKRLTGRPLWYILGDTEFYGCKIKCDERALIPRPETEILAEAAVKIIEDGDKVLDMCTGTGCIAISVAKNCKKKKVQITAVDVSDAAIMLAKENAQLNEVDINFIQSDMFEDVKGRYNVIICNPPYIKTGEIAHIQKEVREFEPRVALDGGDDGLDFYRELASCIHRYIARDGMLLLECGEGQAEAILKLFPKREYAMVIKDYSGCDRFLKIAF